MFPDYVYTLRCPQKHELYGFYYNKRPYIVGFTEIKNAQRYTRSTNMLVDARFNNYESVNESVYLSKIIVPKKLSLNNARLRPERMEVKDFIDMPLSKNIGIVFSIELEETKETFEMSSLVIQPLYNIESYREYLDAS